ncbi:MAG: hypothetical protein P8R42_29175 [Candidatus Binatia bacterium]|nr:hypothetical protein [Candidatus Binatia bacterium]
MTVPSISTYDGVANCLACRATSAATGAADTAYGSAPPVEGDKTDV